jgi:hypothetical protein
MEMMPRNLFLIPIAMVAFCCAAALPAAAAAGRYAVTAELIAAAVSSNGVAISPDQVTMLTGVFASVANPQLRVISIGRAGNQRTIARLECAATDQCLPFFVALRTDDNTNAALAVSIAPAPVAVKTRTAQIAVRSGSTATLLLEGPHVQITLPVICMQNGSPGQTIRTTSPDRRQSYVAQVGADGTLKGRL